MRFTDQSHINRVRDALYQRSGNGASVMVGSGFSRNANRVIINIREMPRWQDLGNHFYEALYPQEERSQQCDCHRPSLDNARIAQEYETAFGRSDLHDVLRRLVPDNGYSPGDEHQRLLQLPWRDIFTTNWDTLLERSRDQVPERHYSVVTSVEEIPMASRPRIVKLHGSLAAQFPLIVTEEDYRTYPMKFAPFVNTVQQAMMETMLLLIGFSGDDPNFLNWSGWVRDNLGPSAPKIYLAGWLGLSHHRRRMLESRNVVPIDLAQHPHASEWPDNLRHNYATEWLLRTLEEGRPYDITSWPTPSNHRRDAIRDILQPVQTAKSLEPKPGPEIGGTETEPFQDIVPTVITTWRHNRLMYPGWLTMPFTNRGMFERNTNDLKGQLLTSLQTTEPVERLSALREIVWLDEILMTPMWPDLKAAIQETLDSIDYQERSVGNEPHPREDWTAIRENWRTVAAALITAARFEFDRNAFDEAVAALEPFGFEDPEIHHRIHHEKCLWALYDRDFDSLESILASWATEDCDPAWIMRKSALLWEVESHSEAKETLNKAATAIKAMPPDDSSLASQSRESWVTFVALEWDNVFTSQDRLRELVPARCDVFGERQSVTQSMGRGKAEDDPPPFDINRRRGTNLRWIDYDPIAATYRAIRLAELTGLPPFTEHSTVWAEVLKQAAEEVAEYDLDFALRLALRACSGDNDKTLERILTRTRVATIPFEKAGTLATVCSNAMASALRNKVTRASSTQQRFNTAAEALSRLTVRLDPERVEQILDTAVEYHQSAELAGSFVDTSIRNLLMRSWEALPEERRQQRALDLLNSDLVGLGNINPIMESRWPDPAEALHHLRTSLIRSAENAPRWTEVIDLVVRGLNGDPAPRRRATVRMIQLWESGQLTDEETKKIADAIWSEKYTPPNGLPQYTELYDWAFLRFPEPKEGIAEQRFHTKWISNDETEQYQIKRNQRGIQIGPGSANGLNHDTLDVESRLWQIGSAVRDHQRRGQTLNLSATDQEHLVQLLEIWATDPVPDKDSFPGSMFLEDHTEQITRIITEAIFWIIDEVPPPEPLGDQIHTKMQQLVANDLPAYTLAVGLVKTNPERTQSAATLLRIGITSDNEQMAADAVQGIHHWLEAASDPETKTPGPPEDLVREIGIAIASRRNTVIVAAMQLAAWIFENGRDADKDAIKSLASDGLSYLAQELRYDREHENPDEIPTKRLYCVELAVAMSNSGMNDDPAVARWLEVAQEDPLPEVREAMARRGKDKTEDNDHRGGTDPTES